jgi:GTPase SAR1 family protein
MPVPPPEPPEPEVGVVKDWASLKGAKQPLVVTAVDFSQLRRMRIGTEGFSTLAAALTDAGHLASLLVLNLGNNYIGDDGCVALAATVRDGKLASLTGLLLESNRICVRGCTALAVAVRGGHLASLTSLNLGSNSIGAEGCKELAEATEGGNLASLLVLNLGNNSIGRKGCVALAEAAEGGNLGALTALLLESNRICARGCTALVAAVSGDHLASLTALDLGSRAGSNSIGSEGCAALAAAATGGHFASLTALNLWSSNIRPEGCATLAAAVRDGHFASLTDLNLGNNDIGRTGCTAVAVAVAAHLGALRTITLNRLSKLGAHWEVLGVPAEYTDRSNGDVLAFLHRQVDEGTTRVAVFKLIVVGPPGQGKTALLRRLRETAAADETTGTGTKAAAWAPLVTEMTDGVDIDRIAIGTLPVGEAVGLSPRAATTNDGTVPPAVEARTWDCGGQRVYKSTNRIFFSRRRSVYTVVYNLRAEITEEVKSTLHDVRCYALGAPVVLVGTHLDQVPENTQRVEALQREFPGMIQRVVNVSSAAPEHGAQSQEEQEQRTDQMRALLRELEVLALGLPGVVVSLPGSWRQLQLWLVAAAQPADGAQKGICNLFRTVAEVQAAAVDECNFKAGDTASVTQALALFHDWGLIVDARAATKCGAEDQTSGSDGVGACGSNSSLPPPLPPLPQPQARSESAIIVIDPPILADIMKCVVTAHNSNEGVNRIRARKGVLLHADLPHVWAAYPEVLHKPLLELLHTFEVAFPLHNTRGEPLGESVIVPMLGNREDALQGRSLDSEREAAVRNEGAQQLFMRFAARDLAARGSRLPPDFVGRLLVRLHRFATRDESDGDATCSCAWQGGCVLGYADNKALLQMEHRGNAGDVLDLAVWGVYPATLRNIVYRAVKLLVEQHYPGLALKETVTCPCTEAECKNADADRRVFEVEELKEELELDDGNEAADKCRRCKKKWPLRWLLPDGTDDAVHIPADVAMQRLEEYEAPADASTSQLTTLAGSNFEKEYHALRPSLLRVNDHVGVDGGTRIITRVIMGHSYEVQDSSGHTKLVSGDEVDCSDVEGLLVREGHTKPSHRDELLWALRRVVRGYCDWPCFCIVNNPGPCPEHRTSDEECNAFMKELYGEWRLGDPVALAAQRLWTSSKKLGKGGLEFCGMWSAVIRRDQASLARPSAMLARTLNNQLVGRPSADRDGVLGAEDFPPNGHCWRGGGFGVPGVPAESPLSKESLWRFFQPGKQYRVMQFLATSFLEGKADFFISKAHDPERGGNLGRELVKWKVVLDPRGKHDQQYRCKHVQLLTETHVQGEVEYLFSAFSVFTVTDVQQSLTPTDPATPHMITVEAALDNALYPTDMELAPWC